MFRPGPICVFWRSFSATGGWSISLRKRSTATPTSQIGAAVRDIHRGCRKSLHDYLTIEPVIAAAEEAQVTIPSDFDPAEIRLVGNVNGSPPFRGVLKHHGWRVRAVHLPLLPVRATMPRYFRPPRWRSPDVGYVVGIDLGTTNSAVAYADVNAMLDDQPGPIASLPIPQVVAVNEVAEGPLLPSFLYLPTAKEFSAGAFDLPWKSPPDRVLGVFAREHGAKVPGRLVSSAKSWLSHAGVDRRSPVLPWTAADDVTKVSPVAASADYLEHLRDAWNARIPGKVAADRLENQEVLLTVPASFDPVARDLTMEAAEKAGLQHVTLLEEPQAAFYAWLAVNNQKWRKKVKVGNIILVCDVGGGTTDFTLIAVSDEKETSLCRAWPSVSTSS